MFVYRRRYFVVVRVVFLLICLVSPYASNQYYSESSSVKRSRRACQRQFTWNWLAGAHNLIEFTQARTLARMHARQTRYLIWLGSASSRVPRQQLWKHSHSAPEPKEPESAEAQLKRLDGTRDEHAEDDNTLWSTCELYVRSLLVRVVVRRHQRDIDGQRRRQPGRRVTRTLSPHAKSSSVICCWCLVVVLPMKGSGWGDGAVWWWKGVDERDDWWWSVNIFTGITGQACRAHGSVIHRQKERLREENRVEGGFDGWRVRFCACWRRVVAGVRRFGCAFRVEGGGLAVSIAESVRRGTAGSLMGTCQNVQTYIVGYMVCS